MTSKTAIEYGYRGTTGRSAMFEQGPFFVADDGRDPMQQAQDRCQPYGDVVSYARRVNVDLERVNDAIDAGNKPLWVEHGQA